MVLIQDVYMYQHFIHYNNLIFYYLVNIYKEITTSSSSAPYKTLCINKCVNRKPPIKIPKLQNETNEDLIVRYMTVSTSTLADVPFYCEESAAMSYQMDTLSEPGKITTYPEKGRDHICRYVPRYYTI